MFQIDTSTSGMPTKAALTTGAAVAMPPQDEGFAQALMELDLEDAAQADDPSDKLIDPDITDLEGVAVMPDEDTRDALALTQQGALPDDRLTLKSNSAVAGTMAASIDVHKADVSKVEQDLKGTTDARGLAIKTGGQIVESAQLPSVAELRGVSTPVAQRVAQAELHPFAGAAHDASAAVPPEDKRVMAKRAASTEPASANLQAGPPSRINPPVATTPGQNVAQAMPLFADESMQLASPLAEQPLVAALPSNMSPSTAASTPVLNRSYASQVASQIATAVVQSSNGTTEIALNPEELGRVRITLTTTEAGLSVAILAERPETADLMRRNLDILAREFRDLGHENLSFTFGDQPDGSDQPSGHGPQSDLETDPNAIPDAAPISVALALSGGLDLKL